MAKTVKKTKINKPETAQGSRQLKKPARSYKSFHLQKRIKSDKKIPSSFKLFGQATRILTRHWKLFVGISLVYGVLNAVLVGGFKASSDLSDAKQIFDHIVGGGFGQIVSGAGLFFYLLSSLGNSVSPTTGAYQFMLVIIVSLALIYALRQVYAGNKVRIRDGFYRGLTSLVTFLLVLLVMVVQLLPLVVGSFVFSVVAANSIAITPLEYFIWGSLCFLLALLSIYLVCSSVFALYIVSLPDVTPMMALRSARQLVLYRRWSVIRKVLFLPLALVVIGATIFIPIILLATPIAPWVFLALSTLLLAIVHGYMYTLYRALL